MLLIFAFAFVAGVLTILSPCTLPIVPLIVGAAGTSRGRRLIGIAIGFAATFVGVTIVVASALAAAGLTTGGLRIVAAVALGFFGATLVVPALGARVEAAFGGLADVGRRGATPRTEGGLGSGIVLGSAISLLWAPCVGPIMAGVIATAATVGPTAEVVAIALAYVAGALVPLSLIAVGGRRVVARFGRPSHRAGVTRSFGLAMVVAALLVATGLDVPLQTRLDNLLPAGWTAALTDLEPQIARDVEPAMTTSPTTADPSAGSVLPPPVASSLPARVALQYYGAAPALTGITGWVNTDPVTLESLRGRVVLVHFWTFGCINCIHVQPYVKAWYDRYAAAGFVVVGVHTPELSFERDFANVREAVAKADVRFPVAFDPDFATWNAYRNQYWPAFYFVDKAGVIRHVHYGEGDYDGSEQVIRQLLSEPG